jgi:SHS2 domain-containing protein
VGRQKVGKTGETMKKDFEVLPHTADLKIRAYGKSKEELFVNALKGMFASIRPEVRDKTVVSHEVSVESHDLDSLLVDFLSEALYLSDVHKEAYLDAEIELEGEDRLKGVIKGVKISDFQGGEIKAVTHHDLKIEKKEGLLVAEILFDL